MIFGNGERVRSLERQIGELEAKNADLRDQLASAQLQRDQCRQSAESATRRSGEMQRLFAAFRSYRQSLAESQDTLAELANRLRHEKEETVAAAGLASSSRESVQAISSDLIQLATDLRDTLDRISGLRDSAEKIGGIVHLI